MHVLRKHADMTNHIDDLLATVLQPDVMTPDPKRGRWRYWRANSGPTRWLFVVVDWRPDQPLIITAFGKRRLRL
jgi:hypothetical protein